MNFLKEINLLRSEFKHSVSDSSDKRLLIVIVSQFSPNSRFYGLSQISVSTKFCMFPAAMIPASILTCTRHPKRREKYFHQFYLYESVSTHYN